MELELWKPFIVKDKPLRYCISSAGRVKNIKTGKTLKPDVDKDGYLRVGLYGKHYMIHRLVATVFLPNPDNEPQVNHKDGVKTNNHVWNLEWCSCRYNIIHSIRTGLRKAPKGEASSLSKYTDEQIIQVCELLQSGNYSIAEVARLTGIPTAQVQHIKNKERWTHISTKYDFDKTKSGRNKYTEIWGFVEWAILNGYKRKIIVAALMEQGFGKDQAVSIFKGRKRYLRNLLLPVIKICNEELI